MVDFAGGVLSFDDVLHDDCLVRLISAVDLEQVSFRKVIASIPYNGDLGNELQIELLRKCEVRCIQCEVNIFSMYTVHDIQYNSMYCIVLYYLVCISFFDE